MDIFDIIHIDHDEIRQVLNELIEQTSRLLPEKAYDPMRDDSWKTSFNEFKLRLLSHDRAEEATLYSAVSDALRESEFVESKSEEHHLIEEILAILEHMGPTHRQWHEELALLKYQWESHAAEEETAVFSRAQLLIEASLAETLGQDFMRIRDETLQPGAESFEKIFDPALQSYTRAQVN